MAEAAIIPPVLKVQIGASFGAAALVRMASSLAPVSCWLNMYSGQSLGPAALAADGMASETGSQLVATNVAARRARIDLPGPFTLFLPIAGTKAERTRDRHELTR